MQSRFLIVHCIAVCAFLHACEKPHSNSESATSDATLGGLFKSVELPPGSRQVLAEDGPIFTDEAGRTLYLWGVKNGGTCKNELDPIPQNASRLMHILAESTPTCAEQWPPAIAKPDAKSVGDWTIVARPEGARQWAYQGHPAH